MRVCKQNGNIFYKKCSRKDLKKKKRSYHISISEKLLLSLNFEEIHNKLLESHSYSGTI